MHGVGSSSKDMKRSSRACTSPAEAGLRLAAKNLDSDVDDYYLQARVMVNLLPKHCVF